MRTFLGKKLSDISEHCFQDKMTLDEFIGDMQRFLPIFKENMKHLALTEKQWPEEYGIIPRMV